MSFYTVIDIVGLQVIHIAYLVWHQCTVDIFLIDWERSRGVLLTTNQNPESIATPTTVTAPVSIWRTYFVANEWNEIQSLRKLNPTLLLLLVLLFLNVSCMSCWIRLTPMLSSRFGYGSRKCRRSYP